MPLMEADYKEHNVQKFVNTRVSEIKNNVIYAVNTKDETNVEINELGLATKTTSGKNYSKITYDDNKRITKYNKNGGELKYNYDEHKLLNQVTYNDKIYKIFY